MHAQCSSQCSIDEVLQSLEIRVILRANTTHVDQETLVTIHLVVVRNLARTQNRPFLRSISQKDHTNLDVHEDT